MPRTAWYGERKARTTALPTAPPLQGDRSAGLPASRGTLVQSASRCAAVLPPKGRMAEGWRDGAAHGPKVKDGAHAGRNRSRPERATACSGLWVVQTRNRVGMRWPQPSQGLGRPQTHKSVPGLPASGPAIAGARLPSFRAGKASCKGASCRVDWRGDQAFGDNRWRSRQSRESSASDDAGRVNFRVEPASSRRSLKEGSPSKPGRRPA